MKQLGAVFGLLIVVVPVLIVAGLFMEVWNFFARNAHVIGYGKALMVLFLLWLGGIIVRTVFRKFA